MASSGSITTNEMEGRSITLSWSLSSQNIENNTSTISWTLKGSGSASGGNWVMAGGFKVVINGTTLYSTSTSTRIKLFNGTVISSGSTTISHNADGTKSFSLSCEAGIYTYAVSATASGTHTLDTIPRASSISATSVNIGNASTLTITRASSSFTHTLTYAFGNSAGTIISKTSSTSVSWTPPISLAAQIPSTTSGTCTITCDTYSDSTKIGTKTCTLTLTVPSSVKPTISSLSVSRIDGDVPSSWGMYVQSKSKVKLTINGASGVQGSTISSYSISGGGFSSTSSTLTTGFLNNAGSITFNATVTDSRGRVSDAKTVSINVVAYSTPTFISYLSQRANSSGTLMDEGTYVKSQVSYSYANCGSRNNIIANTYYKKSNASTWTNANKSFSSGTAFTFGNGNISGDYSYDIKYEIKDTFTTISIVDSISTVAVLMDFKAGGKGIAIGKVSETDNCFEVSDQWNVKVYGKLLKEYLLDSIYPIGSIYMSVNSTSPVSLFGGTWTKLENRFLIGASNSYPLNSTGGQTSINLVHKHTTSSHQLTEEELPNITGSVVLHGAETANILYRSGGCLSLSQGSTTNYRTPANLSSVRGASSGGVINLNFGKNVAHNHGDTGNALNENQNILPPYIAVYMWKRTA